MPLCLQAHDHPPLHIDAFIKTLDEDGDKYNWEHTREGDLAEFLGIDINRSPDGKSFELLQKGLIKKILQMVDPDGSLGEKPAPTRGDGKPLHTDKNGTCLLYTSPSPRDATLSRMPSSA